MVASGSILTQTFAARPGLFFLSCFWNAGIPRAGCYNFHKGIQSALCPSRQRNILSTLERRFDMANKEQGKGKDKDKKKKKKKDADKKK